jgi:hypothetical protein
MRSGPPLFAEQSHACPRMKDQIAVFLSEHVDIITVVQEKQEKDTKIQFFWFTETYSVAGS